MDMTNLKQYSVMALVGILIVSLLKLNLFVTQAQLEQQLRILEAQIRTEYATKQDIQEIKDSISDINRKLDKFYDKVSPTQGASR